MSGELIGELLEFCRKHPVEKVDFERFLKRLANVPQALVDLRGRGWLGIILNRAIDPAGAAPFEWIGAKSPRLAPRLAGRALREIVSRARTLELRGVHILLTPAWAGALDALRTAGASPLYHDWDMSHADAGWGEDAPLPSGWRWVHYREEFGPDYVALLRRSFGRLPGFYMPEEEEVLRGVRETVDGVRVLVDGQGHMVALVRCRIERRYIHAIARDPACRGRNLGRMAMDEARRVLGPGPIALSTVKENRPAVALYTRLGFRTDSELATWSLPVP
jgi:ribosomal protein S18 acetylase RimI-like enzyme